MSLQRDVQHEIADRKHAHKRKKNTNWLVFHLLLPTVSRLLYRTVSRGIIRIHEHHRLISQFVTFRQEIQREIAQVQQECRKGRVTKSNHPDIWQNTKGG